MKILLCNDDGIHAPGIIALHDAITGFGGHAASLGEVMVVAPLEGQSATGHGITFKHPLLTTRERVNDRMSGIAVDGRPADCIKLALSALWPQEHGLQSQPDLVISGMNAGANVGINVLYSGTCAAAIEAAFLGIPAIAVSLHLASRKEYGGCPSTDRFGLNRFDIAARHARVVIDRLLADGPLPRHACININIPYTLLAHDVDPAKLSMPPVRVCPMNTHGVIDSFAGNKSPMGQDYYWSSASAMSFHATEAGSDVQMLFERYITVTPLQFDMTDHRALGPIESRLRDLA
jgi:5'-nucleotidase